MENKVSFLSLDKKFSSKKQKDYFSITVLLDGKQCECFISKETFDKLSIRKLEYLKEYTAFFKAYNRFGSLSVELTDIK